MKHNAATVGIYTDDLAGNLIARAGQKWEPSNGTEGDLFISRNCLNCAKWHPEKMCQIMLMTMAVDITDEEYPSEWCYGEDGQPTCTAFREKASRQKVAHRCKQTKDMFGGDE